MGWVRSQRKGTGKERERRNQDGAHSGRGRGIFSSHSLYRSHRTIEALSKLQQCHILSVPFENLRVFGKEKITLSKGWLFDKIVRRHRGGFCFELNTVFSFLLSYFGFNYRKHAASVFSRETGLLGPPFDHLVLMVNIDEEL